MLVACLVLTVTAPFQLGSVVPHTHGLLMSSKKLWISGTVMRTYTTGTWTTAIVSFNQENKGILDPSLDSFCRWLISYFLHIIRLELHVVRPEQARAFAAPFPSFRALCVGGKWRACCGSNADADSGRGCGFPGILYLLETAAATSTVGGISKHYRNC
jgi:hypothetical protein